MYIPFSKLEPNEPLKDYVYVLPLPLVVETTKKLGP